MKKTVDAVLAGYLGKPEIETASPGKGGKGGAKGGAKGGSPPAGAGTSAREREERDRGRGLPGGKGGAKGGAKGGGGKRQSVDDKDFVHGDKYEVPAPTMHDDSLNKDQVHYPTGHSHPAERPRGRLGNAPKQYLRDQGFHLPKKGKELFGDYHDVYDRLHKVQHGKVTGDGSGHLDPKRGSKHEMMRDTPQHGEGDATHHGIYYGKRRPEVGPRYKHPGGEDVVGQSHPPKKYDGHHFSHIPARYGHYLDKKLQEHEAKAAKK